MTRILVTGASGRLGTAMVRRLAEAGHEVRATSRRARRAGGGVAEWVVADLATGAGLAEAVEGVAAVLHLASAPYKGRYTDEVELDGTLGLIEAAAKAGVGHLVYVSIVGADKVPWGYFRSKVRAERIVAAGAVPYSIVRATQFHEFADQVFAKLPVLPVDAGVKAQPVDVRDLAGHLTERVALGPSSGIGEYGGPEVLTMAELAGRWRAARGARRPVLRMRVPGELGRAFRAGHLTTRAEPYGRIGWRDYLEGH
ncbi:NAD(P)H-binding protein [Nonomuraea sp. NPDC049152]|uniref:SDR family oxidoreductase n=1 Tax=Nonomuraea sp. NPDC049152 TaxID=3154350 RepID=UPI0033E33D96